MGKYFWFEQPKLRNYDPDFKYAARKALESRKEYIYGKEINMGPKSNRDLLDATIYAMVEGEKWQQLGKVTDFGITWPDRFLDIYDMELRITGSYEDQSKFKPYSKPRNYIPKKIIQNGPAFIVFWDDGTKTVLKRKDGDQDDPYAAFGQALMIKIFGTNSMAHKIVDRRYEKQEKHEKEDTRSILEKVKAAIDRAADGLSFGFYSDNKCCYDGKPT